MNEIICAVISQKDNGSYTVDNMVVFESLSAIPAVSEAMGYEYLLPVDRRVRIGDIYDPAADIYTRNGARIYPDLSDKERINALEAENGELNTQVAQLENALCEMDEANAERLAAIEDALCEIDIGDIGGTV